MPAEPQATAADEQQVQDDGRQSPLKDRLSDFLELPDLLPKGCRLRGKQAFIACTSVCDEPSPVFIGAQSETFEHLGMRFGGLVHANCADGYSPAAHDPEALAFAALVRNGHP